MSLTQPIFTAPIVIPATANYIEWSGGELVALPAGTYYWARTAAVAGSFNAILKAALEAQGGGGASWDVEVDSAAGHRAVTFRWNSGTLPTDFTFLNLDVLSPYLLGFDLDATEDEIDFGGGEEVTGSYQPAWLWEPREYTLDDTTTPVATTVVARSISGAAIIDDYGEWSRRDLYLAAVDGARVWQWCADDAGLATAGGTVVSSPHVALESLWRRCRTQPTTGAPLQLRYYRDSATFDAGGAHTALLEWSDPEQMRALEAAITQACPGPLLYAVRLRTREV